MKSNFAYSSSIFFIKFKNLDFSLMLSLPNSSNFCSANFLIFGATQVKYLNTAHTLQSIFKKGGNLTI